ncbi:MAG TPA: alpha/beta fold hydrolase [Acidimicrobiia bacterium]|nr:alpha/beta fold hydrolase [Acidimicrobiia bacterium]
MSPAPPIVLVHGGAHGAWCWAPLRQHLSRPVLAVDLPPTAIRGVPDVAPPPETATLGVHDFADAVLRDADDAGFDRFVLVGHSLGGLTIAEVASRAPERVARLVFVSCIAPPEGQSCIDALPPDLRELAGEAVAAQVRSGTAVARLEEATIRRMFCNDMDEAQTRFVLDHCGSEVPSLLAERVTRRAIPSTLPKTYVRLLRDQSLTPDVQDEQIAALRSSPGGTVDVVELDTGHDVMISAPAHLAGVLNDLAA